MASKTIVRVVMACSVFTIAASASTRQTVMTLGFSNIIDPACPERNGRFPNREQCDAYVECVDGKSQEMLCPEGLFFNPNAGFNFPCGYPIDINCHRRTKLQPPKPTEDCPHQYGYFKVGDHKNCGQFMNCVEGRGYLFDCPEGLAFNSNTYRCDWPDLVQDCDAEEYLGFRCPDDVQTGVQYFLKPDECQRYYSCVNGRPRLQNCGNGYEFNLTTHTCDTVTSNSICNKKGEEPIEAVSHEVF